MEQDFLGLSCDVKRIRPDTLQVLKLSDSIMDSIKSAIEDIRQQQQKKTHQNQKKSQTKGKRNQRSSSPSNKKSKTKCNVLLRGGKTVKKVILEKVSSQKSQTFGGIDVMGNDSKRLSFEFVSTPFNEEIPPIKITKLEKYAAIAVSKETVPPLKPPMPFGDIGRFIPSMYHPPPQKPLMPFPQEGPGIVYRGKVNPKQMIWMGVPNERINMGMNMYQNPMMSGSQGFMNMQ